MYHVIFLSSFVFLFFANNHMTGMTSYNDPIFETKKVFQIYLFGQTQFLHIWERKYFTAMGIMHFFTPSGLHFSSLLLPIKFFISRFKMTSSVRFTIRFLILLPFVFLDDFHSLRRVAMFCSIYLLIPKELGKSIHRPLEIFLLVFFVEFINGRYFQAPLSFTYSYLFWGSILTGLIKGKRFIVFYLLVSQLLITTFLSQSFAPINLLVGQFLTFLFTFFFPFISLMFPAYEFTKWNFLIDIVNRCHEIIYSIGKLTYSLPSVYPNITFLIFIFIPHRFKYVLTLLFLSFDCGETFLEKTNVERMDQTFLRNKEIIKTEYLKSHTAIQTKDGLNCRLIYRNFYWKTKCRLESQ